MTLWSKEIIEDVSTPREGKFLKFEDGKARGGLRWTNMVRRERTLEEIAKLEKKTLDEVMVEYTQGGKKLPIVYDLEFINEETSLPKTLTTQSIAFINSLQMSGADQGDILTITRFSGGRMWTVEKGTTVPQNPIDEISF